MPKLNKDATNQKNYRPISLLSFMCKVMEKMANILLMWSLERVGQVVALQSGFRKNRNAVDALIQFEEDI